KRVAWLEGGHALRVGPPTAPVLSRPPIVIAAVTTHVRHHVDRGAPAEDLAAHRLDPAIVEAGLGLRVVAPVEHTVLPDLAEPDRDVDQRMGVAAARLEEQGTDRRVRREPGREHAARRPRADDDIGVVSPFGHALPYSNWRS